MRGAVTTGDPINDLRLAEHQAFTLLQTAYRRLAGMSFHCDQRRKERLARIDQMKMNWWRALQERDAAEGISRSCGGVAAHTAGIRRGQGVAPLPQDNLQVST